MDTERVLVLVFVIISCGSLVHFFSAATREEMARETEKQWAQNEAKHRVNCIELLYGRSDAWFYLIVAIASVIVGVFAAVILLYC